MKTLSEITPQDYFASIVPESNPLLEPLQEAYKVLADIQNQWAGRYTRKGQDLLCKLREIISEETGLSGEEVSSNVVSDIVRGK